MKKTPLCKLLGIEYPMIQAPMNWITCAELAAAVSNAGGLGVIGPNAGERTETKDIVETGERLRRQIRKTKSLTQKPFGVNLMTSNPDHPGGGSPFSDQCLKVILEESIQVVVLAGSEPEKYVKPLKDSGIKVLHRALPVNVTVAKKAEHAGVDALVAVGFDGGGHTGHDRIPTFVLIPQIVNALRIPVIAGGGIANGKGMAAALTLGAEGVYMGTRFIVTMECPAHQNVKQAILDAIDTSTVTVTGTVGVLRALKTPLMERCVQMEGSGSTLQEISNLYRPAYMKGMLEGDIIEGTFICGAGAGLIKEVKSAGDVVRNIVQEADQILAGRYGSS
jgi:NAD(P)H-dependent flavin oxidoreductase YrpB (nitropropane dioxygenase family)